MEGRHTGRFNSSTRANTLDKVEHRRALLPSSNSLEEQRCVHIHGLGDGQLAELQFASSSACRLRRHVDRLGESKAVRVEL